MGMSVTEKILREHLVAGTLQPGSEIAIRVDQTLTQDATGTMAFLQFEAMGLDRVRNELAVSYVDHNTIQVGFENADDHRYLQSAAARFGAVFSRPGNGVCHQLHLERFAAPGRTLLGSDSHTPTAGGLGMLAIGAGGLDVAVAMGGGPFYLAAPRVIRIWLTGRLKPWVTAKDVALNTLKRFGTQGNVGCVFEYAGPGLAGLDVPERATIANMGAECGVTTTVFPSDAATRRFLEAQGRAEAWRELLPDPDAAYADTFRVNLGSLEPLAAAPHSPGNIVTVASLDGLEVDQVLIGSCTNSSYRDLATVARLLEGRRVHDRVSLGIAPGSRQVLAMLARDKGLAALIASGARLLENACGFCIGNSMSPGTNAVSLRTSNRNFEGRSGTPSARVYLVSPVVAAVAALEGCVRDPRRLDRPFPRVKMPRQFPVDDALFLKPPADGSGVAISRGPNIGQPPAGTDLPETIRGVVAIRVGDKITTDHIMPAGARLKYRSNIQAYARYVFEPVDPGFSERAARHRDAGLLNVIVAGESYGQGSSREHAAMCPMYLGVRAVIAKSIERIHAANLINFGILPLRFADPADYDRLQPEDRVVIPDARRALVEGRPLVLRNETRGCDIPLAAAFSERQRQILLAGGLLRHVTAPA
jgi:aconitate hydratase